MKEKINKKTNKKGFNFSTEATIMLLLVSMILISIPQNKPQSYKELAITQKANDLLRVWSISIPNESEILSDAKWFLEKNYEISINGKKYGELEGKNKITVEGIILDNELNENKIEIKIGFN